MANGLSKEDVAKLMADPSGDNRAETANKLASQFSEGVLNESESELANEIFEIMVRDAEVRVREALANNLKNAGHLPSDIAIKLASDVSDSVALPIIRFSDVLSDADLVEIVSTQTPSRQVAVAERDVVSEAVADAIVDNADADAVASLVSNAGAQVSDGALEKVVDKFGDDERVSQPLVRRDKLPVRVAEKLVAKVSEEMKEYLVTHHDLPDEVATDLVLQSRERATVGLLSTDSNSDDLDALVIQLRDSGRLTPSIVLRALCVGDMSFFETAVSQLAGIPITNARILIHDEGDLGFKSLYTKAGLPGALYPAFRSAVDLNTKSEAERRDDDPEQLMRRMLEHVLTSAEDADQEFGVDNVDYLLAKFNRIEKHVENAA